LEGIDTDTTADWIPAFAGMTELVVVMIITTSEITDS